MVQGRGGRRRSSEPLLTGLTYAWYSPFVSSSFPGLLSRRLLLPHELEHSVNVLSRGGPTEVRHGLDIRYSAGAHHWAPNLCHLHNLLLSGSCPCGDSHPQCGQTRHEAVRLGYVVGSPPSTPVLTSLAFWPLTLYPRTDDWLVSIAMVSGLPVRDTVWQDGG